MPVTKSELIDQLAERLKLERGRAEMLINTVLESMISALNDGDRIEIKCSYDNTLANPFVRRMLDEENLSQPIDVLLGDETTNECTTCKCSVEE